MAISKELERTDEKPAEMKESVIKSESEKNWEEYMRRMTTGSGKQKVKWREIRHVSQQGRV